ncbi:short-chain dehydrogenase [Rhizocola hellebori]|uniref:Short-chain dehydrogenase n=1 Tax=Rhizocola hellebori TaxID=1392758 RepID=A0A8J3VDP1_9ACTN|nr:SDR family oxidoreductase [Rhizocola hellebori]GIH02413.1 short-chain dehydrogenase [Rhizocola hellebori]
MSTTVVVTGGTRGIGAGLVTEFVKLGCQTVYCGRSVADIAGAHGIVADVTKRENVQRVWDEAADRFGGVDIWINNAGMSPARKKLWQLPPADLDATIDLNLRSLAHASAIVLAGMIGQGRGALWNMEGFGSNGMIRPGLTTYGATKRAVTYLTDSLAKEVKGTPVTVHHLSPGMVVTDLLTHDYTPEEFAEAKKIFNILADRVETVTPWLAAKVLAGAPNGARVAWLTRGKAMWRFMTAFRKREVFTS